MSNWYEKLLNLSLYQDGVPIYGALNSVLGRARSRRGDWYKSPKAFVPQFDMLWVSQQFVDLKLFGFSSRDLIANQLSAAAVVLTLPDIGPADGHPHRISALGFAPNGDLWVGYYDASGISFPSGQHVAKLSASKLLTSASVTPDFSFPLVAAGISSGGVSTILFDPAGNMWVSTVASTSLPAGLLYYPAASIASAGSPSPAVIIHRAGVTHAANDLWLDPAGNLWFCDAIESQVCRLSASQLLSSNPAVVPDIVLTIGAYTGCTLDAIGNLWCARSGFVDMFAAANVAASGSPAATRSIATASVSVVAAAKLRFDRGGNLWAQTPSGPHGYAPTDIGSSGSPVPRCTVTGGGALTTARVLNFNPASFA